MTEVEDVGDPRTVSSMQTENNDNDNDNDER